MTRGADANIMPQEERDEAILGQLGPGNPAKEVSIEPDNSGGGEVFGHPGRIGIFARPDQHV